MWRAAAPDRSPDRPGLLSLRSARLEFQFQIFLEGLPNIPGARGVPEPNSGNRPPGSATLKRRPASVALLGNTYLSASNQQAGCAGCPAVSAQPILKAEHEGAGILRPSPPQILKNRGQGVEQFQHRVLESPAPLPPLRFFMKLAMAGSCLARSWANRRKVPSLLSASPPAWRGKTTAALPSDRGGRHRSTLSGPDLQMKISEGDETHIAWHIGAEGRR